MSAEIPQNKAQDLFEVDTSREFRLTCYDYHQFKKSNNADLNAEFEEAVNNGKLRELFQVVDLHSHTNLTDGILSPQELIDNSVVNGVTFLAVTDHNCTNSALEAKRYAEKQYKGQIEVRLGVELATNEGHLLIYFDNEEVMRATEEEFPFLKYVNEHINEMRDDYTKYYSNYMQDAPTAFSLKQTLEKLQKIKDRFGPKSVKTSMAHPLAGSNLFADIAKARELTSLGGVMAHPDWQSNLADKIDLFEVHNDFSPVGNADAQRYATQNNLQNLSTGSDTRIADPQTLTLVKKGEDIFDAIQGGHTIFIQRGKNGLDRYYDRIVAFEAWLLDYYMSEVKRDVTDVLVSNLDTIIRHRILREPLQRVQFRIRKKLYKEAHDKWLKRHEMKKRNMKKN